MTRLITSASQARELLGVLLGPSEPVVIDQPRIDTFAEATGDHQWIHVDPERAAVGPFGATIAHGYLSLSLIPLLQGSLYSLRFGHARLNYGLNKVRFPSPVRVGSAVSATATLTEVRTTSQGIYVTAEIGLTAQGSDRPACVAETVVLVLGGDENKGELE